MRWTRLSNAKGHLLQLSLRTLLIVVTALAVWFGFWANRVHKQRQAVDGLERVDADIFYTSHFQYAGNAKRFTRGETSVPSWLRRILGRHFVDRVRAVILPDDQTTDEDLAHLPVLRDMETLYVSSSKVTDGGVAHIGKLRELKELILISDAVGDNGIVQLQNLEELRYLQLRCSLTDKGIERLASLKKLEYVQIGGLTTVAHETIGSLQEPVQLTFNEAPLEVVLDYLRASSNQQIGIDDKAFQDAGISLDASVTVVANGVPLSVALDEVLASHNLGWMIMPTGLVITTREVVDAKHASIDRLRKSLPNLKDIYIVVSE